MSPLRLSVICVSVGLGALGCQREDLAKEIGPAHAPVIASLQAMGGVDAWRSGPHIRAKAVLTIYDREGRTYNSSYRLRMNLGGRTMQVRSTLPKGYLTASIDLDGRSRLYVRGEQMDPDQKALLIRALEQVLYLAGGPGNFLYDHQTARQAQPAHIAGRDFTRVIVGGNNSRAIAYYFDSVTNLLQYVTSGADRAGGEGSIAAYTYRMLEGGRAFPEQILVTQIGQHVLIGDKPIFKVSFEDVTLD